MGAIETEAPPAAVPVDEVKAFLRVGNSEEDALIAGFVRSAMGACEAFTGLALVERAASEILPAPCPWQRLGLSPVRSIESIAALDDAGVETALPAEVCAIDIDAAGDGWARVIDAGGAKRARVRFTAGMAGDWNGVPEPLRQGIVRLAAHLYEVRGGGDTMPPASVAALWRPWRRMRLG